MRALVICDVYYSKKLEYYYINDKK